MQTSAHSIVCQTAHSFRMNSHRCNHGEARFVSFRCYFSPHKLRDPISKWSIIIQLIVNETEFKLKWPFSQLNDVSNLYWKHVLISHSWQCFLPIRCHVPRKRGERKKKHPQRYTREQRKQRWMNTETGNEVSAFIMHTSILSFWFFFLSFLLWLRLPLESLSKNAVQ